MHYKKKKVVLKGEKVIIPFGHEKSSEQSEGIEIAKAMSSAKLIFIYWLLKDCFVLPIAIGTSSQ